VASNTISNSVVGVSLYRQRLSAVIGNSLIGQSAGYVSGGGAPPPLAMWGVLLDHSHNTTVTSNRAHGWQAGITVRGRPMTLSHLGGSFSCIGGCGGSIRWQDHLSAAAVQAVDGGSDAVIGGSDGGFTEDESAVVGGAATDIGGGSGGNTITNCSEGVRFWTAGYDNAVRFWTAGYDNAVRNNNISGFTQQACDFSGAQRLQPGVNWTTDNRPPSCDRGY